MSGQRAAFVAVDGVLVAGSPMLGLLDHLRPLAGPEPAPGRLGAGWRRPGRLAEPADCPDDLAREYLARLAGLPVGAVAVAGRGWFDRVRRRRGFFHAPVLAAVREHAERGDLVVLVSAGIPACLDPVARSVRADAVLCSTPSVAAAAYRGQAEVLMAGETRSRAVRAWQVAQGISPADCTGYAGHVSDLPTLFQVGSPVVVGGDPTLAEYAERFGWLRLPGPVERAEPPAALPIAS